MKRSLLTAGVSAACVGALLVPAGAASARGGGDEISREGRCTGSTDWELKAKARDGGIEVEWEVDSGHAGQVWRWNLRHDGVRIARGFATTGGRSGSFSVERRTRNLAGVDTFVGRARNVGSGERCAGTLRF